MKLKPKPQNNVYVINTIVKTTSPLLSSLKHLYICIHRYITMVGLQFLPYYNNCTRVLLYSYYPEILKT